MAKIDNITPDDYTSNANTSRKNLKPSPSTLTFERELIQATVEGFRLLAEEEKFKSSSASIAAKTNIVISVKKLANPKSKNPYVQAREEILANMKPEAVVVIKQMEDGTKPKDLRYDTYCKAIRIRGDQLSA